MSRNRRSARPVIESLEGRQLLNARTLGPNGKPINDKDLARLELQKANNVPVTDRRFVYTTPEGTRVTLTLYGMGSLKGSSIDSNGVLSLVYNKTNSSSQIVSHVQGGSGRAAVRTIRDADVALLNFSGIGANQVGAVKLNKFDLVENGIINLAGGVGLLRMRSIGPNTQIDLRQLPQNPAAVNPAPTSPVPTAQFVDTGNGPELAGVGGLQAPGAIGTTTSTSTSRVNTPLPSEINLIVDQINGIPNSTTGSQLHNPQIFGLDPVGGSLVRFDGYTGSVLNTTPLKNPAPAGADIGLGRHNGIQVVLVPTASGVDAYNIVTGAYDGSFSLPGAGGLTTVIGIASTDSRTTLLGTKADGSLAAQVIDASLSLNAGQAVPLGLTFTPSREFALAGGATGLAGTNQVFMTGFAYFDTQQPNKQLFGSLDATNVLGRLTEASRKQITSPATVAGTTPANPPVSQAYGSIDQQLALVTDTSNDVALYDPSTLVQNGSLKLNYANPITGLSESFHTELTGTAVINVSGALHELKSNRVNGLVMTDLGFLNRINVQRMSNSTLVGLPIGHIQIPNRSNVTLLSSKRGAIGDRGAVTARARQLAVGPLQQPIR